MKDFYLSVCRIAPAASPGDLITWAERDGGYLWCVWDIAPSQDVKRAPMTSGYSSNADDVVATASMLGMAKRLRLNPGHHINALLADLVADTRPFYSQSGRRWAVWASPISYLLNQPPLSMRDCESGTPGSVLVSGATAKRSASYLQRYLHRKRIAGRTGTEKHKAPLPVDLLYARDRYGRDTYHRVIRKTAKHVLADIMPFIPGAAFIHPQWRQHIIDIATLPRERLESLGEVDHRPSNRTYSLRPPPGFSLYDEDDDPDFDAFMNEDCPAENHHPHYRYETPRLIELPESALNWALSVLSLPNLPSSAPALKAAFRRAAHVSHPDRGGNAADFHAVRAAYEYLSELKATR